ncbi:restriction endonuclease subunit S [Bacillus toyonensis]
MNMLLEQFDIMFNTPKSVEKLEELILDMAVKGKLVPQDPNEEPTKGLLEKVRQQKEQLIKEKKIKKEKTLSKITDKEKPFKLPRGWEWTGIIDILELNDNSLRRGPFGSAIRKDMFVPKGEKTFKVYEQKNAIKKDCHIGAYYVSQEKYNELKRFEVNPRDIIISCAGTIGETYLLPEGSPAGIINQALLKIRINTEVMLNDFFLISFKALTQKQLNESAKGSAMKNMTSVDYLKKEVLFGLPPINEQKRIVEKVNQLTGFCNELKKKLEKKQRREDRVNISTFASLEQSIQKEELQYNLQFIISNLQSICTNTKHIQQLRNAILSLAVRGKLVPQDNKDESASTLLEKIEEEKTRLIKDKIIKKEKSPVLITEEEKKYELPKGWEWTRLGNLFYFQKGFAFKSQNYKSSGIKIVKVSNLNNPTSNDFVYVDAESKNLYEKYELLIGDIVLTTVGSWPSSSPASAVGNAILIQSDFNGSLLNQNAVRLRTYNPINSNYLHVVLKSPSFKNYIMSVAQGTANQASITQDSIKAYIVGIPPINEQKRIVEKVNQLMLLCNELEENIEQSRQESETLMKAVLQEAFTIKEEVLS